MTNCVECGKVVTNLTVPDFITNYVRCKECENTRKRDKARKEGRVTSKKGYIYIITNSAWETWCKIGVTSRSVEERLKDYQIGSPYRDYEIYSTYLVDDIYDVETRIHNKLRNDGITNNVEWFQIDKTEAAELILEFIK